MSRRTLRQQLLGLQPVDAGDVADVLRARQPLAAFPLRDQRLGDTELAGDLCLRLAESLTGFPEHLMHGLRFGHLYANN